MKILVTGAAGQLGSALVERYRARAEVIPVTRRELDISEIPAIQPFVTRHAPDVIVNCAAYNNVDEAEDHPIDAIRVNALAVRALARAAAATGAAFVHYGTDFVFDGLGSRPYTEDDEPAPQSVYASSKLLGDWFATDAPRHYVLRVESLFGGSAQRSSVDRIATALRERQPSRVFSDRTVTPSFVNDVADATWRLIETNAPAGLYHCVNGGVATWLELGLEIARRLGAPSDLVVAVKMSDVPMKAKRPRYAALSNVKLARAGIDMPSWQDALRRYLCD